MLSVLMSLEPTAASQHCPNAQGKDRCSVPGAEPFLLSLEGSGCSVTEGMREGKADINNDGESVEVPRPLG